jgi:hypothetical protein
MKTQDMFADPMMRRVAPAQPDLWANDEDSPETEPESPCPATGIPCARGCSEQCAMWSANKPAPLPDPEPEPANLPAVVEPAALVPEIVEDELPDLSLRDARQIDTQIRQLSTLKAILLYVMWRKPKNGSAGYERMGFKSFEAYLATLDIARPTAYNWLDQVQVSIDVGKLRSLKVSALQTNEKGLTQNLLPQTITRKLVQLPSVEARRSAYEKIDAITESGLRTPSQIETASRHIVNQTKANLPAPPVAAPHDTTPAPLPAPAPPPVPVVMPLPASPEIIAPPAPHVYQASRFRREAGSFIMEFTDEAGERRQVVAPMGSLED